LRKKVFNKTLVRLAIVSAYPNMKKLALWPNFVVVGRSEYWQITIPFIDIKTNAPSFCRVRIRLQAFEVVKPWKIPDVTKLATFYHAEGHKIVKMETVNGKQVLPPHVDERSRFSQSVHDTSLKFACWITSILTDSIASPAQLKEIVTRYKKLVGCKDGRKKHSR
jgi:hypothetical protein